MSDFLANRETLPLVIFGGKGGAGKTTSAAAAAGNLDVVTPGNLSCPR